MHQYGAYMNQLELSKIANVPPGKSSAFVNRIRRYYCPTIVTQNKCSKPCSSNQFCKENLQKALQIKEARDPVAVLVWRLRDIVAEIKENEYETSGIQIGWTGEAINENPFEMLLEEL